MKKVKILLVILCSTVILGYGQTKTFDSELITFTYPENFNAIPIQYAPHMILKLASNNAIFTISQWDYNIDATVDIWDDEIYKRYSTGFPGSEFIDIKRENIITNNGNAFHCLKILSNIYEDNAKLGNITYIMINSGHWLVFTYTGEKPLKRGDLTTASDKLLSNLYFK